MGFNLLYRLELRHCRSRPDVPLHKSPVRLEAIAIQKKGRDAIETNARRTSSYKAVSEI